MVFSSMLKSSISLLYAAILWFQFLFLALFFQLFYHFEFSLLMILHKKLELLANQRSLHRPVSSNKICEIFKRGIFKLVWDIFQNRPPSMSISRSWIEIDMSSLSISSFYFYDVTKFAFTEKIVNKKLHFLSSDSFFFLSRVRTNRSVYKYCCEAGPR